MTDQNEAEFIPIGAVTSDGKCHFLRKSKLDD